MVAPDLPAHGRSGPWDPSSGDYHDLVTRTCAALAGPGPVDLIGHSLGGTVALRLAVENPGLVRSLVLIEPVLFAAARGTPAFSDLEEEHAAIAQAMAQGGPPAAAAVFQGRWGTGQPLDRLPEAQQRYIVERIHLIGATTPALRDDSARILAPGRLESLACPVCLIDGAASPRIIDAVQKGLMARLRDARRVTVAGASHMVPLSHPGVVAQAIRETLARSAPQEGEEPVDLVGGRGP
jgi:pimeloyl-ACP methyl ester carboxylesterase